MKEEILFHLILSLWPGTASKLSYMYMYVHNAALSNGWYKLSEIN